MTVRRVPIQTSGDTHGDSTRVLTDLAHVLERAELGRRVGRLLAGDSVRALEEHVALDEARAERLVGLDVIATLDVHVDQEIEGFPGSEFLSVR